jgi:hypothetical protein
MKEHSLSQITGSRRESWESLDELRAVAWRRGFSTDQFGHAIDTVGTDPHRVANELQRQLFMAALYLGQSQAA